MNKIDNKTIGELVAENYRTASIFESMGVDFCCKGGRTLDEVCEERSIDKSELLESISQLQNDRNLQDDYQSWDLDRLIDHIESKHHRYVEEKMPVIDKFLVKLSKVHGGRHPELYEVRDLFKSSLQDLSVHMKKEELLLFPFIKKLVKSNLNGTYVGIPQFNTVKNPIKSMMNDHNDEGDRFRRISELTGNYKVPEDGCNTYHIALNMLKEFEEDLHMHIHLENNILFPKAEKLEMKIRSVY